MMALLKLILGLIFPKTLPEKVSPSAEVKVEVPSPAPAPEPEPVVEKPLVINKEHKSINFNSRKKEVKMIVIHWTSCKVKEALNWMTQPKTVASHYLIDIDGTIYQLVEESERAWHAGTPSSLPGYGDDINSSSVGIELCGPPREIGLPGWPEAQIEVCAKLCKEINARFGNTLVLTDHSSVGKAFGKTDVLLGIGIDKFPWEKLVKDSGLKSVTA